MASWWTTYKAKSLEGRKRSLAPTQFADYLAHLVSIAGWGAAGINGTGLALAITFMIASYTSLTTSSDICIASQFVSYTIQTAMAAAVKFFFLSIASVFVTIFPYLIGAYRHTKRYDSASGEPIKFGNELEGLTERRAMLVWGLQITLIFIIYMQTLNAIGDNGLFFHHVTPEQIQRDWAAYRQKCPVEPNPL